MIPALDDNGNLPAGVHEASWQEIIDRFGGTNHRLRLLSGLRMALDSLKRAGCKTVYLDGSFVTSKQVPNDFDGCWDVDGVNPNLVDPVLLDFTNGRAAQKAKFFGELFPVQIQGGPSITFLIFFQRDRDTGEAKGIIAINLQEL